MGFKVVGTTEDTVTIWDGSTYVLDHPDPKYRATTTITVGRGHPFNIGDEVEFSVRKVVKVPEEGK